MPAGTREALQHGTRRCRLIEMHRLRIEFGGKFQHLLARDMARPVRAETAGRKIFEAECHAGSRTKGRRPDCGRSLRQSQPEACAWAGCDLARSAVRGQTPGSW